MGTKKKKRADGSDKKEALYKDATALLEESKKWARLQEVLTEGPDTLSFMPDMLQRSDLEDIIATSEHFRGDFRVRRLKWEAEYLMRNFVREMGGALDGTYGVTVEKKDVVKALNLLPRVIEAAQKCIVVASWVCACNNFASRDADGNITHVHEELAVKGHFETLERLLTKCELLESAAANIRSSFWRIPDEYTPDDVYGTTPGRAAPHTRRLPRVLRPPPSPPSPARVMVCRMLENVTLKIAAERNVWKAAADKGKAMMLAAEQRRAATEANRLAAELQRRTRDAAERAAEEKAAREQAEQDARERRFRSGNVRRDEGAPAIAGPSRVSEGALVHDEHVQSKPRRTARNVQHAKEREKMQKQAKQKRASKKKEEEDAETERWVAVDNQATPQRHYTLGEVAGLVDDDCTQRP